MRKATYLELDKFSKKTVKEIKKENPELWRELEKALTIRARALVRTNRGRVSSELSALLRDIDWSEVVQPGGNLETKLTAALQRAGAKDVVLKEMSDRFRRIDGNGLLSALTDEKVPVERLPFFQSEFERARLLKITALQRLPEAFEMKVVARVPHVGMIDDRRIQGLVDAGILNSNQANELGLNVTLYNSVNQSLALVKILRGSEFSGVPGSEIARPSDIACLTRSDWERVVRTAKLPVPDGQTEDAYHASLAVKLCKRATSLFPTDALLSRAFVTHTAASASWFRDGLPEDLRVLKPLFAVNEGKLVGRRFSNLTIEGIAQRDLPHLQEAHARIQKIINLNPGLQLDKIINRDIYDQNNISLIQKRIELVRRVAELNAGKELLKLDYSPGIDTNDSNDVMSLNFDGLSDDEKKLVIANFKAQQRVFALSQDVDDTCTILGAGYASATSIARSSLRVFRERTGFSAATARAYHRSARKKLARVSSTGIGVADAVGGSFRQLAVSNFPDASFPEYLKRIEGFAELFGKQNYCRCEHCQSIFSPAAYFVDVMAFVHGNITQPCFIDQDQEAHELTLKKRRPDLWDLPLDCQNTKTEIPYLDIINEVLENYIAQQTFPDITQTADRAVIEDAVYRRTLAESAKSFRQPFCLPMERLDIYLKHFKRTRAEIARAIGMRPAQIAAATLGLSDLGEKLITLKNENLDDLRALYGVSFELDGSFIKKFDAQELLRFTGLTRRELGELIRARFVADSSPAIAIIGEKTDPHPEHGSVQNDIERIHGLTLQRLDRMHRLIRLWRHLPTSEETVSLASGEMTDIKQAKPCWSIRELDLVLEHLDAVDLRAGSDRDRARTDLVNLTEVLRLQTRFDIPVDELCALWSTIPTTPTVNGGESLFHRLFNFAPFRELDGDLPDPNKRFLHPAFRKDEPGTPEPPDNTLHRLLAALRVNDEQLARLIECLQGVLNIDLTENSADDDRRFELSLENLTHLYRHALLGRLLSPKEPVAALRQFLRLAEKDTGVPIGAVEGLETLKALLEFVEWREASGFGLDDLLFITTGERRKPETYPDALTLADKVVQCLADEKAFDFSETVFAFMSEIEITEEQSRQIIQLNPAAFDWPTADRPTCRLRSDFDPYSSTSKLEIPAGLTPNQEPLIRRFLGAYHAATLLPKALGLQLKIEPEKAAALLSLLEPNLGSTDVVEAVRSNIAPFSSPNDTGANDLPEGSFAFFLEGIDGSGAEEFAVKKGDWRALDNKQAAEVAFPGIREFETLAAMQASGLADGSYAYVAATDRVYFKPSQGSWHDVPQLDVAGAAFPSIPVFDSLAQLQPCLLPEGSHAYVAENKSVHQKQRGVWMRLPITPRSPLLELIDRILPLATLFANSVFDAENIQFVQSNKDIYGITDFDQVKISSVRRLSAYVDLIDLSDDAPFADEHLAANAAAVRRVFKDFANAHNEDLAQALRAEASLVSTVKANIELPDTERNKALTPVAIGNFRACVDLAHHLGVDGRTLRLLAAMPATISVSDFATAADREASSLPDGAFAYVAASADVYQRSSGVWQRVDLHVYQHLLRAAQAVLAGFRAKYPDEDEFAQTLEPFENRIRGRKRDALTDFLVSAGHPAFESSSDLFHHFLLDTQLEGCARTSRVAAAISSVQMYVHRVLMNLEESRDPPEDPNHIRAQLPADAAEQWVWRKNYRVWEANRKVFLYPENYIEPELRDNKTPLFEELESTLLQQPIDEQNVLDAYASYLNGFDEIANLKIAGAYHEKHSGSRTDVLHLFGVTPSDPPVHYYRTIENPHYGETEPDRSPIFHPWRKINVQVPVRNVSPIIYLNRLMIFWNYLSPQPKTIFKNGNSILLGYNNTIKVQFSLLRLDETWTAPQNIDIGNEATIFDALGPCGTGEDDFKCPMFNTENKHALDPDTKHPIGSDESYKLAGFQWEQIYPYFPVNQTKYLKICFSGFFANYFLDIASRRIKKDIASRRIKEPESVPGVVAFPLWDWRYISARTIAHQRFLMFNFSFGNNNYQNVLDHNNYNPARFILDDNNYNPAPSFPQATILASDENIADVAKFIDAIQFSIPEEFVEDVDRQIAEINSDDRIRIINGKFCTDFEDAILDCNGDQFLVQGGHRNVAKKNYIFKRIGTTLVSEYVSKLVTGGIDELLDVNSQKGYADSPLPIRLFNNSIDKPKAELNIFSEGRLERSFGVYEDEIFFHIPLLIADHLHAQGNHAHAQRWYHYIFDPTATKQLFEDGIDRSPTDRVWQFLAFRGLDVPKLRAILTDQKTIHLYETDPFNPHAIARLRVSAYQKCVVMKYIDNLLAWGDGLFSQFTRESVNEALLLYVLAADILGPRPAELGPCQPEGAQPRTYEDLEFQILGDVEGEGPTFLVEVETLLHSASAAYNSLATKKLSPAFVIDGPTAHSFDPVDLPLRLDEPSATVGAGSASEKRVTERGISRPMDWKRIRATSWTTAHRGAAGLDVSTRGPATGAEFAEAKAEQILDHVSPDIDLPLAGDFAWSICQQMALLTGSAAPAGPLAGPGAPGARRPGTATPPTGGGPGTRLPPTTPPGDPGTGVRPPSGGSGEKHPYFCVPENKDLRRYWDHVEDRLFKIRNCMDIAGVRRELALFAPEIDPRLLVRAKAEGLSIEDVLNAVRGDLPPYRFTYLIEKAKQYAGTLQSFGSTLLSAIEKRDTEALNRLRTTQQQNLLKMKENIQQWEIDIATETIEYLKQEESVAQARIDHYDRYLANPIWAWERTQQVNRHLAKTNFVFAGALDIVASLHHLLPQLGAPTSIKWGGAEMGRSVGTWSDAIRLLANMHEAIAASAGLEGSNQRREDSWRHEKKIARKQLDSIAKQKAIAEIKKEVAKKSKEVFDEEVAQIEELFAFYEEKFTNLGLNKFLTTTLRRVYREAYNSAFAMARLAEQAYRFERGDEASSLLASSYWDAPNGGLLAGERLMLDLQNLERRFLETNDRTPEIHQSFSLTQIAPAALLQLRQTGRCAFEIPEFFFDLFYPGHYRRRIKAVRLTIPCVTGPYTNVAAKLTLTGSKVRTEARTDDLFLKHVPVRRSISIATSSAQNDAGVFEFSFRDERYMPFEGAGAISQWQLALPKTLRPFDYETISDVMLHVSYTAEDGGEVFGDAIENRNAAVIDTLIGVADDARPFARMMSLRHDFSSEFHRLLHSSANTAVKFEITNRHLPIFSTGRRITVKTANLILVPAGNQSVGKTKLAFIHEIPLDNDKPNRADAPPAGGNWRTDDLRIASLPYGDILAPFEMSGLLGKHTLVITDPGDLARADNGAIDPDTLRDILIYIEYQIDDLTARQD